MTTDGQGGINFTEVVMFLHVNPNTTSVQHIKLTTQHGHTVTSTPLHLIYLTSSTKYVFAQHVRVGDELVVHDVFENRVRASRVVKREIVYENGSFAPLTASGSLLVNDVHVSCYAIFWSHRVSHIVMSVWRWIYSFMGLVDSHAVDEHGIHWAPAQFLYLADAMSIV